MNKLTVGTRGSALALRQTELIVERLRSLNPGLEIEVRIIKTKGDKILDEPLTRIAGKGFFVAEIERALIRGEIDFAVHSMKDLPAEMTEGLVIAAIPEREDPSDALISRGPSLHDLPKGARIGTSSPRRQAQLRHFRPDLELVDLRGNLDTRIRRLEEGRFDAVVLAYAGLRRMGWEDRVTEKLPPEICLPAVGQGALAVQTREDNAETTELLARLDDAESRAAVTAERSLLSALGGGCQVPIGALGVIEGAALRLRGVVASPDGKRLIRGEVSGDWNKPEGVGRHLADVLVRDGADAILRQSEVG
jgi:hydroxymethylbilane synthase